MANLYSIMANAKDEASDVMMTSNILVCDCIDCVLFDPGSNFSCVRVKFVLVWNLKYEFFDAPTYVYIFNGVYVCVDQVYRACPMMFMGFRTLTNLVILDIEEFDNILRMSQLSPYHVILNCIQFKADDSI